MQTVRKGYCYACPFDYYSEDTMMAQNLGCLPSPDEVKELCAMNGTAWACHSEPDKVCCGDARRRHLPLQHMEGVHS